MVEENKSGDNPADGEAADSVEWQSGNVAICRRGDGSRYVQHRYSSYHAANISFAWYGRRDAVCVPERLTLQGRTILYEYVARAAGPVDFKRIVAHAQRYIWLTTIRGGIPLPNVLSQNAGVAAMARDLWGPDEPALELHSAVRRVDRVLVEAVMRMLKDFATQRSLLHACYDVHGDMLAVNCICTHQHAGGGVVFVAPKDCMLRCAEVDIASLYLSWHGWPYCPVDKPRQAMLGWRPLYTRPVAMLVVAHLIDKLHNSEGCTPQQLYWAQALLVEQLCLLGYMLQDAAMERIAKLEDLMQGVLQSDAAC